MKWITFLSRRRSSSALPCWWWSKCDTTMLWELSGGISDTSYYPSFILFANKVVHWVKDMDECILTRAAYLCAVPEHERHWHLSLVFVVVRATCHVSFYLLHYFMFDLSINSSIFADHSSHMSYYYLLHIRLSLVACVLLQKLLSLSQNQSALGFIHSKQRSVYEWEAPNGWHLIYTFPLD